MHSRTFATPSADGGVGVRAMIPVIDMFNHAGDEAAAGLLSGESAARDNCRWGPVAPGGTDAGEWVMQVRARFDFGMRSIVSAQVRDHASNWIAPSTSSGDASPARLAIDAQPLAMLDAPYPSSARVTDAAAQKGSVGLMPLRSPPRPPLRLEHDCIQATRKNVT